MGSCGSCGSGAGPFSEGRELVEFVYQAHGGALRGQPVPDGGLAIKCHGCGTAFTLRTFVDICPDCGGVHAVSPPRRSDPVNVQFAGPDFALP
ncbi:MAG: hypothetical protein C0615_09770 [Desulfuromonas sp.]|nr:MAG: hypothetical protein C0615_09770 [Desulfuromonas sp.]